MADNILEDILNEFPGFFYREIDGNHYKLQAIEAEEIRQARQQMKVVELAGRINRPIKIWRSQFMEYEHSINVEIELEDIKRVKIYRDGNSEHTETPALAFDTGDMDEGINTYSKQFFPPLPELPTLEDEGNEIIPTTKWFVEVEDHHENIFQKGIPINPEILGDRYDQDLELDVFGINFDIPRRTLKTVTNPTEYQTTYPQYYVDVLEDDKTYQDRLKATIQEYVNFPLPAVEVKKYFNIFPTIEGRWRHLCRMGTEEHADVMAPEQDAKYMATQEWDSPVFDVVANLNLIPSNMEIPTVETLQSVVDRTFPLSKKAYFSLMGHMEIDESINLDDYFEWKLQFTQDRPCIQDSISGLATFPHDQSRERIHDYYFFRLPQIGEWESLKEQIIATQCDIFKSYDTKTDFNKGVGTYTNLYSVGSGNASIGIWQGYETKLFWGASLVFAVGWTNPYNILTYLPGYNATCTLGQTGTTNLISVDTLNVDIPNDAKVVGCYASAYIANSSGGSIQNIHSVRLEAPGIYVDKQIPYIPGGVWNFYQFDFGCPSEEPWRYKDTSARLGYSSTVQGGRTVSVNRLGFNIVIRHKSALWVTEVIPNDEDYEWNTVRGIESKPSGTTILYDVLNANTDEVLLENQTMPVDISSISNTTPIKVKAKFTTNNVDVSPLLDKLEIRACKDYPLGTVTIYDPDPEPEETGDPWVPIGQGDFIVVSYDKLRVYDLNTQQWVNNFVMPGDLTRFEPLHIMQSWINMCIDNTWGSFDAQDGTFYTENEPVTGFVRELPNTILYEDRIALSGQFYNDEWGCNYILTENILNQGETVIDAMPLDTIGATWTWIILTDSRLIKCKDGAIVQTISLSNGLCIANIYYDITSYTILIYTTTNLLYYECDDADQVFGLVTTDSLPPTLLDADIASGFRVGASILGYVGEFAGAIEFIKVQSDAIVLYDDSVSLFVFDYDLEEWVETAVPLPQTGAHHVAKWNTYNPHDV